METNNLPIPASEAAKISTRVALELNGLDGRDLAVESALEYSAAASKRKSIKDLSRELEDLRKHYTGPLDELKRRIMDWFSPHTKILDAAAVRIGEQLMRYDAEQRRKREEQQRALEAALRAKQAAEAEAAALQAIKSGKEKLAEKILEAAETQPVAVPQLVEVKPIAGSGISYRDAYKFEVVNAADVPRQFLCVDEKALRAYVTATKAAQEIPGVKVWSEKVQVQR